ncbi:MAG: hypothetical protein ABIH21_00705 [Patescibacteria group bacterium]
MTKGIFTRSVAKHIRIQKGVIRRHTQDKEEQKRLIRELLNKFTKSKT